MRVRSHISETKGTSRPSSNLFEAGVQDSRDEHDPAGRTANAGKACQKRQCTNAQSYEKCCRGDVAPPSALRNRVGLGHHNTSSLLHSVKPEHDIVLRNVGEEEDREKQFTCPMWKRCMHVARIVFLQIIWIYLPQVTWQCIALNMPKLQKRPTRQRRIPGAARTHRQVRGMGVFQTHPTLNLRRN